MPDNHVLMPKLGLTMEEGEVVEWHVEVGQHVNAGDDIVTIFTDKVETVVETPWSGRVREIVRGPGEVCPVGEPLCTIEGG